VTSSAAPSGPEGSSPTVENGCAKSDHNIPFDHRYAFDHRELFDHRDALDHSDAFDQR
jgi:hypothetical protein